MPAEPWITAPSRMSKQIDLLSTNGVSIKGEIICSPSLFLFRPRSFSIELGRSRFVTASLWMSPRVHDCDTEGLTPSGLIQLDMA